MEWFTEWLSRKLGRVVTDQTGLQGEFDFAMDWAPDPEEGNPEYTGMPPGAPLARVEKSGPSIFTALQEQLGLRLEAQRAPAETLIIDHVDRPSVN